MPFVQGLIRGERISGTVATECAHCHRALHFSMDSEFSYQVEEAGASPVLFAPWSGVEPGARSIIDGF